MSFQLSRSTARATAPFSRRDIIKLLSIALAFVLLSTAILELQLSQFFSSNIAQLSVGDIAPEDIISPEKITYESAIGTEAAKDRAENQVTDIYRRPDPAVARTQQAIADDVLAFLDAVRADPNLSATEKLDWIQKIQPITFTREEAAAILNLSDTLWLDAKQEVRSVLDDAMRAEIRESQLISVRRRLDLLISSDVPKTEADVIAAITEDLVQPNTFVDEDRTKQAREDARAAVTPVLRTLEKNEVVVRQGERINAETIEALQAMGLQQTDNQWLKILTTFLWVLLFTAFLAFYLVKYHPPLLENNQHVAVMVILLLIFMVGARITATDNLLLRYAMPMAALTLVMASLFDAQLAVVATVFMGIIEAYVTGNSLEMFVYVLVAGFVVALTIGRMAQVTSLLWAGVYAALSNIAVILMFRLVANNFELADMFTRLGGGLLGGVLSAGVALLLFFAVGGFTEVTTYLQLLELSRPTHPLLTELLRRAPGTYHHSLLVSNLAEQAAERIGANAFVCRVGAYYHDVGKIMRPYFFTENSPPGGTNLHEPLEPEASAKIIISHVTDGLKLAKKYRLPRVIRACIAEHHGSDLVGYFYFQAVEAAGGDESKVDRAAFQYPGPKPQSKETAVLMLADASEATVRSVQPQSSAEIEEIVRRTIQNRIKSGQFDECDLTMRDLEQIREAFIELLKGVSHPRIKYPGQEGQKTPADVPPLPLAVQSSGPALEQQTDPGAAKSRYTVQRE